MQIEAEDKMQRWNLVVRLARENWEEFVVEWERQTDLWLKEISQAVADPLAGRPAYDVLDEAQDVLRSCGERAFREHAAKTIAILLKPVEEAVRRLF